MPEPHWQPALDDSEADELRSQVRRLLRGALPDALIRAERGDPSFAEVADERFRLRVRCRRPRQAARHDRPVLALRLQGDLSALRGAAQGSVERLPLSGEVWLDVVSQAVVELNLSMASELDSQPGPLFRRA